MAQVIPEAVESGIAHGISAAVGGGLISPDEVVGADEAIQAARDRSIEVISEESGEMPPWQQYLVGELLAMTVFARRGAGTLGMISMPDVKEGFRRWWEIIDRF
jgi:hypothetical protein